MRNNGSQKINANQIALLHVAKKELALDEENYRSILKHYKVKSAKDLTLKDFRQLVKYLETLGFTSSNKKPTHAPNRDANGLPYPAQLADIYNMFDKLVIRETYRQRRFCERVIKKPWPQTRGEANKIYEALKAMLAREQKKRYDVR